MAEIKREKGRESAEHGNFIKSETADQAFVLSTANLATRTHTYTLQILGHRIEF